MLPTPQLTDAEIRDYERDGYVLVRRAFDAQAMVRITLWTDEIAAWPEQSGRHWVYHETSRLDSSRQLIARIEHIAPFHAGFRQLTEALKPSVGQLLGEPATLFKEKINFKMPGGDGFKPHQDSQAGWEVYASQFVTVIVCIDEATIANGCLRVAPGQHKRGLFRAWEPLTEADTADMKFVDCPMRPGDLLYLGAYTPHASEPNPTNELRRLHLITYNRLSQGDHYALYHADKHKNYPPDIDREAGKTYVYKV
ncbi:MAG: phytanoyl-CoA dioxygenase family protein [Alphaproteobacteria bacterium]|nr:phytanoyl-CoA dioxygenase family protein [Alphaproteobacteria bacterium]